MLRDLPPRGRWYILSVILLGAVTLAVLLPRATFTPVLPLLFLILLSSLTSAFKVRFPIASGSSMSVSYIVDIASLILRGPHATMLVGAVSGWSQTNLNSQTPNPHYRTLFNMSILVLTAQASGQVYERLGGTPSADLTTVAVPLAGMALTYFFLNTVPIAFAIALTTNQHAWRIWKTEFASSAPSYFLGALAAAVVIAVTRTSGYWLTLLFIAAPLYLTFKLYRTGVKTEARQGAILEAAHDAIVTLDQHLNIREFNPAAEQIFGHEKMNVLGRGAEMLLPPAGRAEQLHVLAEYQATGGGELARRRVMELTAVKGDGTEFPAELTVARVGTDVRAVITVFIRDMTEQRALEAQLRQSQKLEAIGRLAGGVAHDFNNILMSIMGAADLLLMQLAPDDPAREEASEVKQSVERGAGVTRQLLAFSRRQKALPRLFALGDVVRGMDTMLRRLIGPEIEFTIVCDATPVMVVADSNQVEQVVMNLSINARDAMPDGGRLTVRVDEVTIGGDETTALAMVEGKPGRYAHMSVSDTGTGMDEHTRAKLFEPFFTTKEEGKGTGLGLSIVYGIVKQSGGHIQVSSEVGRGATFDIYLPVALVPEVSHAVVV